MQQPPAPPPFYALSLPHEALSVVRVGVHGLRKADLRDFSAAAARGTEREDAAFITEYLEENGDEQGRLERWRTKLSVESNLELGRLQSIQTAQDELTKQMDELQSKLMPQPLPIPRPTRGVGPTPANCAPGDFDTCLQVVQEQAVMETGANMGRVRRRARRRASIIEDKIEDDLLIDLKTALTNIDKRLEALERTNPPEQSICESHFVTRPSKPTSQVGVRTLQGLGSLPESMRSKLRPNSFV